MRKDKACLKWMVTGMQTGSPAVFFPDLLKNGFHSTEVSSVAVDSSTDETTFTLKVSHENSGRSYSSLT